MDRNPYAAPQAAVRDPRVGIRWPKALSVWWSAAWRGALYGMVGGFLLGAVGGVIAVVAGTPEQGAIYGAIGGYVAAIPASMLGLKQALSKHLASLVGSLDEKVA
jgi:hypothetical protein